MISINRPYFSDIQQSNFSFHNIVDLARGFPFQILKKNPLDPSGTLSDRHGIKTTPSC